MSHKNGSIASDSSDYSASPPVQYSPVPTSPAEDTRAEEKMRDRIAKKGYESMVEESDDDDDNEGIIYTSVHCVIVVVTQCMFLFSRVRNFEFDQIGVNSRQ